MVKVIDGKHYMISTKRSIFEVLVFKITRFRNYQVNVNKITRTISFTSKEEATRCMVEMAGSEGVVLTLSGKRIKVHIPERLIELVD